MPHALFPLTPSHFPGELAATRPIDSQHVDRLSGTGMTLKVRHLNGTSVLGLQEWKHMMKYKSDLYAGTSTGEESGSKQMLLAEEKKLLAGDTVKHHH